MGIISRFRRGQIRGIDFSLALIIFLLTMTQVLALTNTFIENAQSSQGISGELSTTENFANELLFNPGSFGSDTSWYTQDTATLVGTGWSFGMGNGNGSIDPFKIGRLANNSESSYLIDYSTLRGATAVDRDFEIRFRSQLDVKLTSVTDGGGNFDVVAEVTSSTNPIQNAEVILFSIDNTFSIQTVTGTTDSSGILSTSLAGTPGDGNTDIILAIVNYGLGLFDVDYIFFDSAPTLTGLSLLGEDTSLGYAIDVSDLGGAFEYASFYTRNSFQNYTSFNTIPTVSVPQTGMSVIVASDGSNNIGITTFPLILDDYITSPPISLDPVGEESTAIERSVMIRGVLMKYLFLTWS